MKIKLSQLKSASERKKFIEEQTQIKLNSISSVLIDTENTVKIENLVGATSIPLGIAGPLLINGENGKREVYLPLTTTEGVLVASVSRGCKAIAESEGAEVSTHHVGTTRGPVFHVKSIRESKKFYKWIKEHEKEIGSIAESTSKHIKYKKMMLRTVLPYVFIRFYFDTDDAMGMNMVTIASNILVEFIEKETGVKCLSVAGNFDIDKKPAWLNFIENRGFKAWAEVILKKSVVEKVLKVTPENFYKTWLAKCIYGSIMSGSLGFNAQFANVIAALYASTGQDLAHVVEGSLGITTAKILESGDLYVSVYLPSLMVGTVGGGTKYATQREALQLLNVTHSQELVEVIAGAVLAGEISLIASQCEGTLACAHEKLAR